MSFRIELDKYDEAYGCFMRDIRNALQQTYEQESDIRGLKQVAISEELGVDPSVVSRRLSGKGNVTLKTICDLYVAMGRAPLANFASRDVRHNALTSKNSQARRGVFVVDSQTSLENDAQASSWFSNLLSKTRNCSQYEVPCIAVKSRQNTASFNDEHSGIKTLNDLQTNERKKLILDIAKVSNVSLGYQK